MRLPATPRPLPSLSDGHLGAGADSLWMRGKGDAELYDKATYGSSRASGLFR